jgi:hypothetical protein
VIHLDGSARESAQRAADAARRLIAMLAQCASELRTLSLGSGMAETDRIVAQLGALESAGHADDETGRLAELLRAQLEIVRRMRVRGETLSARRAQQLLLLSGLWSRVEALAAGSLTPAAERAAVARLDAVREEIEAELERV